MLYAVRGNKQLRISEKERKEYLALGYDIAEVKGKRLNVVEVSPAKTVPYPQHQAALDKIAVLEKEIKKLKKEKGGK